MRAYQRYGWQLNKHELNLIAKRVQRGDGTFVERQSNRVTVWDIEIKGEIARIVYDSQRHQIVTFLPKGARHDVLHEMQDPSEVSGEAEAANAL